MLHTLPLDARGTDASGTEMERHRTEFITIICRKWLHVSQEYKERSRQIEMDGNGGNNENDTSKHVLLED